MNTRLIELAKKFKDYSTHHAALTAELKQVGEDWEKIESELLEAMVDEGVKSINIEGVGQLSMRVTNYLSVNVANKPSFFKYLKDIGEDHILKLDVNPRTLTAYLREHHEALQKKWMGEHGFDEIEAREKTLEFLKEKGAAFFTKRDIALKGV